MNDFSELLQLFPGRCLTEAEKLKRYSSDMVKDSRYRQEPAAVVFPVSTGEVADLMKWANRTGTAVTARGAGSGLSGGAIPTPGAVVCSFEKMNKILEIDPHNMMVTLEPGVITNELDAVLKDSGMFFAGYPMSEDICFIGGNVAENAGGGRAVKYGVTSNYVIGAEVVSPTGDILKLGGKRLKDVSGYNLLQLMVGSEGTLGLFTSITLRLVARPMFRTTILASFSSASDAAAAVSELKLRSPAMPCSIEFIDGNTARQTMKSIPSAANVTLSGNFEAVLLVEYDSDSGENVESLRQAGESIIGTCGGNIQQSGSDQESMDQCWALRKAVPWWTKQSGGEYISLEDVVVAPALVPELVEYSLSLRDTYAVEIAVFGHAGDGNFHLTPMKPKEMPVESWYKTEEDLLSELYAFIDSRGGAISGEHGIGRKRVKALASSLDAATLAAMKAVKKTFDPNNVLNPGVLFDMDL